MAHAAYHDPLTGDYVLTAGDDFQVISGAPVVLQAMLRRLLTRRGSCVWAPSFGSTLHELPREKAGGEIEQDAEARVREALEPLRKRGEVVELEVGVSRVDAHRLSIAVRARDAGWRPLSFTTFVRV